MDSVGAGGAAWVHVTAAAAGTQDKKGRGEVGTVQAVK